MMSPVSVLIVYLIGVVLSGVFVKVIDIKDDQIFRHWSGYPNLGKIAIVLFLWPIIVALLIIIGLWTLLWELILPVKK